VSGLEPFRRQLDELDEGISRLLGERFEVCREIAHYKQAHDIPMMQPGRVAEVRARYLTRGAEVELPPDFTAALFELLIGATCKMEDELIAAAGGARAPSVESGPSVVGGAYVVGGPSAEARDSRAPAQEPQEV
jgi:chorismate mutase